MAASVKSSGKTKTEGAVKGGEGTYQYALSKVKKVPAGTGYSSAHGGVRRRRSHAGRLHSQGARRTGSRMHQHANEQFNYVVSGHAQGAQRNRIVGPPAHADIHTCKCPAHPDGEPEEDVIFIAIKDLSQGISAKRSTARWPDPLP